MGLSCAVEVVQKLSATRRPLQPRGPHRPPRPNRPRRRHGPPRHYILSFPTLLALGYETLSRSWNPQKPSLTAFAAWPSVSRPFVLRPCDRVTRLLRIPDDPLLQEEAKSPPFPLSYDEKGRPKETVVVGTYATSC